MDTGRNVYQDLDPVGTGKWYGCVEAYDYVIGATRVGPCDTEEAAHAALSAKLPTVPKQYLVPGAFFGPEWRDA